MNILTFDIEEWYLEKTLHGGRDFKYRNYDETFERLMTELDRLGIKATFFCVGRLAAEFPQVVRRIAEGGHEIGCHSDRHEWLTKMERKVLKSDTEDAIHALEDVGGQKVVSYRAPAFSITEKNGWAIEILAECGIENDSSIFPASRDFGGYPTFATDRPCLVQCGGATIREFPIAMTTVVSKRIAFSGGGYFRMLPYGFVRRTMGHRDYNICYFHLNDLIDQRIQMKSRKEYEEYFNEPGTLKNRLVRYAKSNIGTGDGYGKLVRLLGDMQFTSLRDAAIDWDVVTKVSL